MVTLTPAQRAAPELLEALKAYDAADEAEGASEELRAARAVASALVARVEGGHPERKNG